jgi:hypothetical protein
MLKAPTASESASMPEAHHDWSNPLFTDLYQLTMAYAEWKGKR